ncbi:ATP-binding protein [Parasphingorhabdus halotolerans]|uniref:histidine kinase n=1 Tax=Parasphingorhabdus halotolerans TaxID=2725558 RepID=A0A6H2DLF3_9SPHN|nr:ATP-binding protein [Parasphingorhabdus halotolerans]QJB68486.1 ATPase [Parasphingorhabdus halotolerans]
MSSLSPFRIFIAILLTILGALISAQSGSTLAQIIIMSAAGISAIAIAIYDSPDKHIADKILLDRQRERYISQGRIEAYQNLIDPLSDPVMLIRNAKVAMANASARKILGNHIVGEDVRVAIRHPAAADRLANPETNHSGEPILLVGVGSAEQRWELRINSLNDGLKLVQLSDQSSSYAAERMRTDFVANASHELRTPLAAIKGFIETLQNPAAGKDDDTRARFLKIMFDEADRMQRLVEDLMSLSRIEAEKFQLPNEPVDLSKLIAESKGFFLNSRGKKDRDYLVDLPTNMPFIVGDRSQLAQLIQNLVSNAFKYGRKGTPIKVHATINRSGAILKLSVSDQGDGIAPEHLTRLTERFYRVDKGRSKAIGGTGLGLAIVKHIAERHGGRLEISSVISQGTTVSVFLPIAKSAADNADVTNES